MSAIDLHSFGAMIRDMYPRPGERVKQYVVDMRREDAWEAETCPTVHVPVHDDNTGVRCRNEGPTRWTHLQHDCCGICDEMLEGTGKLEGIRAWLAEKAKRPPVEADRTKLSDEIEPDRALVFGRWFRP